MAEFLVYNLVITRTNKSDRLNWISWRKLKIMLRSLAMSMYTVAGFAVTIKGRQAKREEAPVLVVSPHSSFLDAFVIYATKLTSPLVRNADKNMGSKSILFNFLNFYFFYHFYLYLFFCFPLAINNIKN